MCLIVNKFYHLNGKAKIAKRDIPCYKVLNRYNSWTLVTPVQHITIESFDVPFVADSFQTFIKGIDIRIKNGIHTFRNEKKALNMAKIWDCNCVMPCYIPKGTKYWIGTNKEYCSEKIMWGSNIIINSKL